MTPIAAVILAGGDGGRVGTPKLTLRIGSQSYLERIAGSIAKAGASPVVAVVHEQFSSWVSSVLPGVVIATITDSNAPMSDSLRTGIALCPDGIALLVTPVDHPLVAAETYRLLVQASQADPEAVVKPACRKLTGHPIIIPSSIVRLMRESPAGASLREVIRISGVRQKLVDVDDSGILTNVNTLDDLNKPELR